MWRPTRAYPWERSPEVLNNLYVKPGNRERVEASIRKLNYRVDTYARGMKAQRTYTAAILVPDLINPFFAMLVNDVEQVLAASGYRLLVCNSHNDADRELSYLNMARQNRVDGLIALTYSNLDEYLEAGLPVVSIDRHFSEAGNLLRVRRQRGGRDGWPPGSSSKPAAGM